MTSIEKTIALINFIRVHDDHRSFQHLVVKKNTLYVATWEVNGHNGNIDDYEERIANEKDVSPYIIDCLENEMVKIKDQQEEDIRKKKIINEFYIDVKQIKKKTKRSV